MIRWLFRALLLLALCLTTAEAQQEDGSADAAEQGEVQDSADSSANAAELDADDAEVSAGEDDPDAAPVGESPSRFIPTEQLSQDLGVSFPADI